MVANVFDSRQDTVMIQEWMGSVIHVVVLLK
jgi:hypothetical protein